MFLNFHTITNAMWLSANPGSTVLPSRSTSSTASLSIGSPRPVASTRPFFTWSQWFSISSGDRPELQLKMWPFRKQKVAISWFCSACRSINASWENISLKPRKTLGPEQLRIFARAGCDVAIYTEKAKQNKNIKWQDITKKNYTPLTLTPKQHYTRVLDSNKYILLSLI